ncbi:MAG: hypothetical protein JWM34_2812 [Ilumatobacteraceae bacterium]|nr:hypothetical protein [Ilumatobacteraceae bacterium]
MRQLHLTPSALDWLSKHHGIIDADRLEQCGVSARTRRRHVAEGLLVVVAKGVYRIASTPPLARSTCVVLSVAHPTGFVTGPAGGRLRGLWRMPKTDIHYCVPHGHELRLPGIIVRQSRAVDEAQDVQVRADGIRIATPWRLAFDLAADLDDLSHRSVTEQILRDGQCGMGALIAVGKRLANPHRPGSQRFIETLTSRLPGGPLESHPEVVVASALQSRGLPIVVQQTWLDLPNGRRIRLDISVPDICWGLEIDIHPDHFLRDGNGADRQRDRQCHLIGWQVDRVTALDLLDLDALADELVELYRRRRADIDQLRRGAA